jgi:molecular chaperone GrpE (heat shock protein)
MAEFDPLENADRLLRQLDLGMQLAQKGEEHRRQLRQVLLDLVEVVDALQDLELHFRKLASEGRGSIPTDSVSSILKRARNVLARWEIEPMDASGHELDLERHEVVGLRQAPSAADLVVEEIVRGYVWKGQTLRRAKVVVSSGPDGAGQGAA